MTDIKRSFFKPIAVLLITTLCIFMLSGCEGQNGDADAAQGGTPADAAGAPQTEANDNPIDFQFEGNGDQYSGLTSQELLNLPVGDSQNRDSVTENVPQGINVEREPPAVPTPTSAPSVPSSTDSTGAGNTGTTQPPAPATAKGISVYPDPVILYIDKTNPTFTQTSAQLTATLYGGTGTVNWTCSDPNVAMVNGGGTAATVDARNGGNATVTATIAGTDYSASVLVVVREATPQSFYVDDCLVQRGGDYSATQCDAIIAAINNARADYSIPALIKNTGLCKVADVRAKEISYAFMSTRPDGSDFTTVAPKYYKSENMAALPKGSSATAAVDGLKNYTTTRRDIMDENFKNIGASYYTFGDYTYVVVALGY
ncbi:MAG: hypothetical protein K5770_12235 [Lachnospiraceae bacterium]|nr:hypothetical protein [Lachnospiraceae bacterium]